MRIFVLVLSLIGAFAMIDHALIPVRLTVLAGNDVQTLELAATIALFALWAVAAGLVYCYPSVAVWTYAVAGAVGLYTGLTTDYRVLVIWGVLANAMAVFTTFARREKRRSDRRNHDREQQLLAISLAMPGLAASVTDLQLIVEQPEYLEMVPSLPVNGARGEVRLPT